ncbi:hypothetical protein PAXINDRAFT_134473 [Paxillus involutus ATCC 200175]|uniref:Uncharacterized protein n=1 Tax=Paxillus involutus ATCC 200175 TaxID=664439 RepID=A0A0C9U5X8_PAXIN|nr:hypothetical protein PAXINDRAFT_134473 [Paxillus involutus ATCC 200175]
MTHSPQHFRQSLGRPQLRSGSQRSPGQQGIYILIQAANGDAQGAVSLLVHA